MLSSNIRKSLFLFVIFFLSNLIYAQSNIIEKLDPFDGKLSIVRYEQDSNMVSLYEPQELSKFENKDFYNWYAGYGWHLNLMQIRFNGVQIEHHLAPDLDDYKNSKHGKHSGFFPLSATLQFPDGSSKIFNIIDYDDFYHKKGFNYAFWPKAGLSQDGWVMNYEHSKREIYVTSSNNDKYIFSVDADNHQNLLNAKLIFFEDSKGDKIEYQYEKVFAENTNEFKTNVLKKIFKNNIPMVDIIYEDLLCTYPGCNIKYKIIKKIRYGNKDWYYDYSIKRLHGKKYIPFLKSITDSNGLTTNYEYNYEANNGKLIEVINSDNSKIIYNYSSNKTIINSISYYGNQNNLIGKKNYHYDSEESTCNKWQIEGEPLKCITNKIISKNESGKVIDKNIYTYSSIDSPVWSHGLLLSQKTCDVLEDNTDKCIRTIDLFWDKNRVSNNKFYYNSEKFDQEYNRAVLKKKVIEQDKTKYITEYLEFDKYGCPVTAIENGITETGVKGTRNIKVKNNNFYCSYPKNYNFPLRDNLYTKNKRSNEIKSFDAIGRIISRTIKNENINATTKYNYISDNGIEVINAEGHKEISYYQPFGNPLYKKLIKNINLNQVVTEIDRDLNGIVNKIKKGNYIKSYFYNAKQKLIEYIEPKIGFIKYERDEFNNKIQKTNSNGDVLVNHFDSANNLIKTHFNKEEESNFYSYDNKNRLIKSENQNGVWNYFYDNKNNIIEEKLILNNREYIFKYFYNNQNKLTSMLYPGENNLIEIDSLINNVVYNSDKKIEAFNYGNGIKFKQKFNAFNKPSEINYITNNSKLNINYGYDLLGNVIKILGLNNLNFSLEYDNGSRIIKILDNKLGKEFNIEYDDLDNVIRVNNKLYQYDQNNRLLGHKYDGAGRVINDGKHNYSYNSKGQLIAKDSEKYWLYRNSRGLYTFYANFS